MRSANGGFVSSCGKLYTYSNGNFTANVKKSIGKNANKDALEIYEEPTDNPGGFYPTPECGASDPWALSGIPRAKTADFLLFHVKQQGLTHGICRKSPPLCRNSPVHSSERAVASISRFAQALYSPRKHRAPSYPLASRPKTAARRHPKTQRASFSLPRAAAFFFLFARKCPPSRAPPQA